MNLNPLILSGVALGLSACVSTPAPQKGTALAGAYAVAHEGGSYAAQVGAGPMGHALTRAGAAPVSGLAVTVSPFGMDQGRRAKAVPLRPARKPRAASSRRPWAALPKALGCSRGAAHEVGFGCFCAAACFGHGRGGEDDAAGRTQDCIEY